MSSRRIPASVGFCFALFAATSFAGSAQQPAAASQPPAGSNWRRVQALPPRTGLHVTTDHGGVGCKVFAVTEDALTCAKGSGAGRVIARSEIKHIKLTHYVRSTLAGLGVGAGAGAIGGAIGGRQKPCTAAQNAVFLGCLDIGIGQGGVAAIFATAGGVLGAAIGGPTDFARGSSIYVRP